MWKTNNLAEHFLQRFPRAFFPLVDGNYKDARNKGATGFGDRDITDV